MISTFCHDAPMPSQQDIFAGVDISARVFCPPPGVRSTLKGDAARLLHVSDVSGLIDVAKIAKAVVGFVMVNVINDIRLLAMRDKPCNAVRPVTSAIESDVNVARGVKAASDTASRDAVGGADHPGKHARARVVIKSIADRIRDALHLASMPYRLGKLYHG